MIEKLKKYDKVSYGVIIGLALVILGFLLSFAIKTHGIDVTLTDYLHKVTSQSPDRMDIIIFSMLPNMLLFYFTNFRWNLYELTKGLVGISLIMAVIVIVTSL